MGQLDARITELKAKNKGLVDKALELVGDVIETVKKRKDMLMGVLSRAAGVVGKILKDPIGFVGNLVAGARAGFQRFVGNIGKHLKDGLMGWLLGKPQSAPAGALTGCLDGDAPRSVVQTGRCARSALAPLVPGAGRDQVRHRAAAPRGERLAERGAPR